MKTLGLLTLPFVIIFLPKIIFSQSNWNNTFIHDANQIVTMISNDDLNLYAFSSNSQDYLKSSDGGVTWNSVKGFDTAYTFQTGQFVNANIGWIGGINTTNSTGQLFKTSDAGNNWYKQILPISGIYSINCMMFVNENTGWLGTYSNPAKIFKTINGGINWSITDFANGYLIGNIQFVNSVTGWSIICYPNSKVLKTSDQGENWINVTNNAPQITNIISMYAENAETCWVTTYESINSIKYTYFYKTTNSGINWNLIYTYSSAQFAFNNVVFRNSVTGYAYSGTNFIIKTTNSGINWFSITNVFPSNVNELFFKGDNHIYAAGGNGNAPYENFILNSTNSGNSWTSVNHNRDYSFSLLNFVNSNTGFAVTDTGRIYRTTNFGGNWNLIHYDTAFPIASIDFKNNSGIITGPLGSIKYTSNYGNNWTKINTPINISLNKVYFFDQNNCWAVSNNGGIMKSQNSGLDWIILNLNQQRTYNLLDVCFLNNNTGWVLASWITNNPYPIPNNWETAIFKTTNAGLNWFRITSWLNHNDWPYRSFKFINENIGYVMNKHGLLKTINGGNTWLNLPSIGQYDFYLNSVSFINENSFWVGGYYADYHGVLFKTIDGGNSWQQKYLFQDYPLQTIKSVWAIDSNKIMFGGDYSNIYATTNGGGVIGLSQLGNSIPKVHNLYQNYPNPFNPNTKIKFDVPYLSNVRIIVYDIAGRELYTILDDKLNPGTYEYDWKTQNISSGVYFYCLESEQFRVAKKMILLK